MAAIKHTLQREVFLPSDERLVGVVHVTKGGRKKKASFLCIAVTTDKPVTVCIHQVKKSDKADSFKKKACWMLRQLKQVDGIDSNKDTAEFDLQFEKASEKFEKYKWVASSLTEKTSFIACIYKLAKRYLITPPEFVNVAQSILEDVSQYEAASQSVQAEDIPALDMDYHALSSKEESDVESLMSQCEFAISNAEAFSEQLSNDLSVLDGANIHSIMASEDKVVQLMRLLDEGLSEANYIEEKLDYYDQLLQSVRDQMEVMKDKDSMIQTKSNNHKKLLTELDDMMSQLDLNHVHMKALLDGDLITPTGICDCTTAAEALHKCMQAEIHPALSRMAAVQEQQKRFTKLKATFAKRLAHHLNNLFIHQGNELGETLSRQTGDLKLPRHHSSHRDLTPYAELMYWLKQADNDSFTKLAKVYTTSLSKLYDREVRDFIENAKQKLAMRLDRSKLGFPSGQKLSGSSSSLNKSMTGSAKSSSQQTLDSETGSDPDISGRQKFDQIFDMVLCEMEPVCLAEQDFCVKFFHLTTSNMTEQLDKMIGDKEEQQEYVEVDDGDIWKKRPTPEQRQINEEVRRMMSQLFPSLETELNNFVAFGDRLDNFNSMYMFVRMSQHVNNTQDVGSFLSKTFGNCLVQIKRNFDKFVQNQIRAIVESKVSKKTKCGIIPFVANFEDFAHQAENIFKGSDRRTDLDKSLNKLVRAIFDNIGRVALEHTKTPKDVVMLENFHHMYATLSQLKFTCLEGERKEAKQKYQDHLQAYVTMQLGRPLEKLNHFFEGIESRVATGVKWEEVGYQLAFSKQELRKVIKEYPGKEVKKNLESLNKKVEKHLCEDENLTQVVWHSMQDEFIKQYKHFEQLIAKCYPGAMITLDFTIQDVLQYFSDIAQSH